MDEASDTHDYPGYRDGRCLPSRWVPGRARWATRPARSVVAHNRGVPSALSPVPIERRQRLLPAFGLLAALLVAIGVVAVTGDSVVVIALGAVAIAAGVLVGLVTWGLARSIRIDRAEQHLDGVIEQALQANGVRMCECGHEHDPNELHVTDGPGACQHDGRGADCAHSCETCVLAALHPDRAPTGADPLSG
jgi:hypothetical protein